MEDGFCILLAEDEALIAMNLLDNLVDSGYSVRLASSGLEALSIIEEREQTFLGLITDIQLGAGPDGWDLAHRARELNPDLPVLYMSGNCAHEYSTRGVADSRMVQKPFTCTQMMAAMSSLQLPGPNTLRSDPRC